MKRLMMTLALVLAPLAPALAWEGGNQTGPANAQSVLDSGSGSSAAATGYGGRATARGGNATGGSGYGGSGYGQGGNGGTGVGGVGGSANVTVNGGGGDSSSSGGGLNGRIPAATAYSAPTSGFDVCGLGNPSAGGQGLIGATLNLGERLDLACALQRAGRPDAAIALLCRQHDDVRQAMKDIGTPCPQDAPKGTRVAVVTPAAAPIDPRKNADWCDTLDSPAERREYAAICSQPNHRTIREPRHLAQ